MRCYVDGCQGFAKRCWRTGKGHEAGPATLVVHACADHWPKVAG